MKYQTLFQIAARFKTLPFAFLNDEVEDLENKILAGDLAKPIRLLEMDIRTHKDAGNFIKADYEIEVLTAMKNNKNHTPEIA